MGRATWHSLLAPELLCSVTGVFSASIRRCCGPLQTVPMPWGAPVPLALPHFRCVNHSIRTKPLPHHKHGTGQGLVMGVKASPPHPNAVRALQQCCLQSLIGIPRGCSVPSCSPASRCASEVGLCSRQFALLEVSQADLVASRVWQGIHLAGGWLPPFQSALIARAASSCAVSSGPNPAAGLVSVISPPSLPHCLAYLSIGRHVRGCLSHWRSKSQEAELIPDAADDQAELGDNELQLISQAQKRFSDSLPSCSLKHP